MASSNVRRCPVCGAEMVCLAAQTAGRHPWRGWHCNRCQHEEQVRVTSEGGTPRGRDAHVDR